MEGVARHGLEAVHQVVAGEVEAAGEAVHAEVLRQVGGDVAEDLVHLGVQAAALLMGLLLGAEHIPAEGQQELLAEEVRHLPVAEILGAEGALQALEELEVGGPVRGGDAEEVEVPAGGLPEAGIQGGLFRTALAEPVLPQPEDHPLIGLRGVDDGPVDAVMGHQQQVPGLEEVGDALHHVGDLAPQQEDDLVELMVMIADLLGPAVLQPDEAEVLPEITPLARVRRAWHGIFLPSQVFPSL